MDRDFRGELAKVVIELPEPDMGVTGERVWAVPLGSDLYEIRNSPWHSRQVNWGDIVKARAQSDVCTPFSTQESQACRFHWRL